MSLFKSLGSLWKKAAPVLSVVGHAIPGVGTAVALAARATTFVSKAQALSRGARGIPVAGRKSILTSSVQQSFPTGAVRAFPSMPGVSNMSMLGALPGLAGLAGMGAAAGRVVMAGASTVARSAVSYCKKHPGWCSTIGGTIAVESMIRSGQLPPMKKRRAKGLSPGDLRSFRRVANLMKRHYTTAKHVPCKVKKATCR